MQTMDGRKVELLRTNLKNKDYPILGIVTEHDGSETMMTWTENGSFFSISGASEKDLMNVVEKVKVWANIYDDNAWFYKTREQADAGAGINRIACIELEYTKGDGIARLN